MTDEERKKIDDFMNDEGLLERLFKAYNDLSKGYGMPPSIGNWFPNLQYETYKVTNKEEETSKIKFEIHETEIVSDDRDRPPYENDSVIWIPKKYILDRTNFIKNLRIEKMTSKIYMSMEAIRMDVHHLENRIEDIEKDFRTLNEIIKESPFTS